MLGIVLLVSGCTLGPDHLDPDTLPYRLNTIHHTSGSRSSYEIMHADLTGDGPDEYILHPPNNERDPFSRSDITLYTPSGRTIEQVNFAGQATPPFTHDVTGDGRLEILVPVVHENTLGVHVVDATGNKLYHIPIMSGTPRQEPEGEIEWFANVHEMWLTDVTGDGDDELVTIATTRLARTPRGVFVHRLPDGEELSHWPTGTFMGNGVFIPRDSDNPPSIVYGSSAVNNGANVNGQDDRASHVGRIPLPSPLPDTLEQAWGRRTGGLWTKVHPYTGRFTSATVNNELVVYLSTNRSRPTTGWVQRLDASDGSVQATYRPPQRVEDIAVGDVDSDGRDEIALLTSQGDVDVLDGETLAVESSRRILPQKEAEQGGNIDIAPDVTGDGIPHPVVSTQYGVRLLSADLTPIAALPDHNFEGVIQQEADTPPSLHLNSRTRTAYIATVEPNPLYLAYRYSPYMLGLLGIGGIAGLGYWMRARSRRLRLLDAVNKAALNDHEEGAFLYRPAHTIEPLNDRARYHLQQWVGTDDLGTPPYLVKDLTDTCPSLAALCTTLRARPPDPVTRRLAADTTAPLQGIAQLLPGEMGTAGYGVLLLRSTSDSESNPAWRLMAQRIAHDLKNPLTSILLTLQRLQMEYHDRAPDLGEDLDAYTDQIENRVARLRRMTKNFMKFVDVEEPQFTSVRLNEFIDAQKERLSESVPPDVNLKFEYTDAASSVRLDADQMLSVLENLVANAVNAMPEGGRITVSTSVERELLWDADASPRDMALIEVMDTGTGMDETTRKQLFEPGFTTRDDGTGLGLAIVRKVISDHNGSIEVESEPGTGSVFCILLPIHDGEADGNDASA